MKKRGFIWWALRVSFGLMILFVILSTYVIPNLFLEIYDIYGYKTFMPIFFISIIMSTISIVFTILISIIHLKKYKEKIFPIVVLIISGLLTLWFVFITLMLTQPLAY